MGQIKPDLDSLRAMLVAISIDPVEKQRDFRASTRAPFRFLSDPQGAAARLYAGTEAGSRVLKPATFVIDRRGIVRWRRVGESPPDRPAYDEVLAHLRAAARNG